MEGCPGRIVKKKSHPAASPETDIFFFLALNKSNNVFARGPRFHFLKNKAGMLYEMLVSYSAAYIKNLDSKL